MAKDDDILQDARELFEECEQRESDNRDAAKDDLDFGRLGIQWSDSDRKARDDEGRPCLTINKLPAFVRQVVNDARQNTPSIVVRPVDSAADVKTAEVMSGLIRDIEHQSDADTAYDTALDMTVSCGFGFYRINLEYVDDSSFAQDIRIKAVQNPFSIYGDPYSDAPDSADWNSAFVIDKMKRRAFENKFKGKDLVSWEDARWNEVSPSWKDGEDVTFAEFWVRDEVTKTISLLTNGEVIDLAVYKANLDSFQAQGIQPVGQTRAVKSHKVRQHLITACDVLETTEWAGRFIPIIPVYGEDLNVGGKRHLRSLIRDAKDPQRMHNYWRTVSTEMVALAPKAPWVGKKGAFKSDPNWATADKVSHATLEYDGDVQPSRQPFTGTPVGVINEALAASDDMKAIMGMYDASLGQRSNETSGRAILARQREGDVGSFHFSDNLARSVRHGGRILIDLIPHVYTTERVIRILGPDKKPQTVQIGPRDPNAPPPTDEQLQAADRIYDLTVGRYDLAVDAGPSFTTRREEAATQMMELIRVYPAAAPLIADLLAENLDWPGATEIAKRLKAMLPPQLQTPEEGAQNGQQPQGQQGAPAVPPEVIQQAQQIIEQLKQELASVSEELKQTKQDQFEARSKVLIDAYSAETDRLKLGLPAPNPLNPASLNMAGLPVPQPSQQPGEPGLAP